MSNYKVNKKATQFGLEFQTVVLAGGRGSRINQLLNGKPKCLLPVANKPMIQYPLELLIRHHIYEAFVVVLDDEEEQIKSSIRSLSLNIDLQFISIPYSQDFATADSLRFCRNKLKKDILLIPCDLITDTNLDRMIELYRLKNASFLCLLSSIASEKENVAPANKFDCNKELDYVGVDSEDTSRLVFFEPDVMFNEFIPLKKSLLRCCPNFTLYSGLMDAHVYLFRNWILDYLDYKVSIRSMKLDLLPSLVRKQFRSVSKSEKSALNNNYDLEQPGQNVKNIFDFIRLGELETYLNEIELRDPLPSQYPNSSISCVALILNSGYCVRTNNLSGFCEANRQLLMNADETKLCNRSILGQGSVIGEKCDIKRTVIGTNCQIGDGVTMVNCILQNNVKIEFRCKLINSLICSDATIGSMTQLDNCLVGSKQKVGPEGRFKNESIMEEMLDF